MPPNFRHVCHSTQLPARGSSTFSTRFSQGSLVEPSIELNGNAAVSHRLTRGASMNRIIATGIVLLSLSSVAEAHRLSGSVTYYGGSDGLCGRRTANSG